MIGLIALIALIALGAGCIYVSVHTMTAFKSIMWLAVIVSFFINFNLMGRACGVTLTILATLIILFLDEAGVFE